VIFWIITIALAIVGWRWKRWKGVFIVLMTFWITLIIAGVLFLSLSEETIRNILKTYPAPSSFKNELV
jgi:hypothetical protein